MYKVYFSDKGFEALQKVIGYVESCTWNDNPPPDFNQTDAVNEVSEYIEAGIRAHKVADEMGLTIGECRAIGSDGNTICVDWKPDR